MPRPNFVFIMTDTQGANVLGCHNIPELQTPNLDRLAAEGVRFDHAYTTCPLCTPARGGIFTGLTPSVNGAHTNNLAPGANIRHMGHRFEAEGYHTAYIGKWHLDGLDYFDSGICPSGWDNRYWYDGRRYLDELSDAEKRLWRQGLRTVDDLRQHGITPAFTWAHRLSDRAIDFLENRDPDKPFLLVCSYDEPHGPSTCPAEYIERFDNFLFPVGPAAGDELADKPAHHSEWAETCNTSGNTSTRRPRYFGCNSFVDHEIGRVIDGVADHAPENTWIIFTSDHGDMLGAHRITGKGPAMYNEITRIPFIIRPPSHACEGVVSEPVGHLDLLPTMLEAAGLETPPILHGTSLCPVLDGARPASWLAGRSIPIEFTRFSINHDGWGGYQPIRCIVMDDWKFAVNLLDTDEMYNLADDPAELTNLVDSPDHTDTRLRLHDALLAEMDRVRDPFRGPAWERRPWREDPKQRWSGGYRHRPDDGFMPTTLVYNTGRPPASWVEP